MQHTGAVSQERRIPRAALSLSSLSLTLWGRSVHARQQPSPYSSDTVRPTTQITYMTMMAALVCVCIYVPLSLSLSVCVCVCVHWTPQGRDDSPLSRPNSPTPYQEAIITIGPQFIAPTIPVEKPISVIWSLLSQEDKRLNPKVDILRSSLALTDRLLIDARNHGRWLK